MSKQAAKSLDCTLRFRLCSILLQNVYICTAKPRIASHTTTITIRLPDVQKLPQAQKLSQTCMNVCVYLYVFTEFTEPHILLIYYSQYYGGYIYIIKVWERQPFTALQNMHIYSRPLFKRQNYCEFETTQAQHEITL